MSTASSKADAIFQAYDASVMAQVLLGLDGRYAAKPCDLGKMCETEHHYTSHRDERSCLVRLDGNPHAPSPCELRWDCDAFHHWYDIEFEWYCATRLISEPSNPNHYRNGDGTWRQYTVIRPF